MSGSQIWAIAYVAVGFILLYVALRTLDRTGFRWTKGGRPPETDDPFDGN